MNEIDAIHTDITNLTKEISKMKEVSNELRKQNSPLSSLLAYYIDTHIKMMKNYISTCELRLNGIITQEQFNQVANMWVKSILSISDIVSTLNGESGIIKYTNKLN